MFISKEEKEEYERRFHNFMLKIIRNEYINFSKKEKTKEISLNELFFDGQELIDMLVGDSDVACEEFFEPDELELIFEDVHVYKAVKSLTYKEKLAIFLRFIIELDKEKSAKLLGVKSKKSVERICRTAINKIRKNLDERGI